ncbi:hypothetical protein IAD21_00148 [Abditibacteriota bacterium]|nr:hypothetical protein IAD21_00148 [Abditibacteriota bacterium]
MQNVCVELNGMPAKQHLIRLSPEERAELQGFSQSPPHSVREKTRARLLLGSDTNVSREEGGSLSDLELSARYKVTPFTVASARG